MPDPLFLIGAIWALFFGWAASSYSSNFAYRLPRRESPFGREPYCGDCDHKLHPKDLFPIFSWIGTGGTCRYCGSKVPFLYFLLEVVYPIYVLVAYLSLGFSDGFLLLAGLGMLLQIQTIMLWEDDHLSPLICTLILTLGLCYGLIEDISLIDSLMSCFFALMIAIGLNAIDGFQPPSKEIALWPRWIWLAPITMPWITSLNYALIFVFLWVVLSLILKLFIHRSSEIAHSMALGVMVLAQIVFVY